MSRVNVRRARTVLASIVAAVLLMGPAAFGQVQPKLLTEGVVAGYATGTVVHTGGVDINPSNRVANIEVAHAGASVGSQGLGGAQTNEFQRIIRPAGVGSKNAYAFGEGVEAGVLQGANLDGQVLLAAKAESSAPPAAAPKTNEVGPLDVDPIVYASALRGQAATKWNGDTCVLGDDISRGLGYAADAQIVNLGSNTGPGLEGALLGTDATQPSRAVSQTLTRNRLVPQIAQDGKKLGDNFGLMSEVRQTIAPITLLRGGSQQTIEFLGEWVLRVVATGEPGGAYVHYGPGTVNPQTPVLRIIDSANKVTTVLSLQDLLGPTGLSVTLPSIGEVTIGEDPRAIGGNADSKPAVSADGTSVSAAVDVVRVRLLPDVSNGATLRVGHMEATAQVPAGGIRCDIPVTKIPDPGSVTAGQPFVTHININNPFDCDLGAVKLVDEVTTPNTSQFPNNQAAFRLAPENGDISKISNPNLGGNLDSATFNWPSLGTIPKGGSLRVTVPFQAQGGNGLIVDNAMATGTLINCSGEDASLVGSNVGVTNAVLNGAAVAGVRVGAVRGVRLARTGAADMRTIVVGSLLIAMAAGALALRRRQV